MAKNLKVKIITMDKEVYNDDVISIKTVNAEGEIQFLANHAPIITNSVPGKTEIVDAKGEKIILFTSEGILTCKDNTLVFMTGAAERIEDIDIKRAEQAAERAKKRIEKGGDFDIKRAQLALARANERIKIKSME